jgi:hypothetical protein
MCTANKTGLDFCRDIVVYEVDSRLPLKELDDRVRKDLEIFASAQSLSVEELFDDANSNINVEGSNHLWSNECLSARKRLSCTTQIPMCVSRPSASSISSSSQTTSPPQQQTMSESDIAVDTDGDGSDSNADRIDISNIIGSGDTENRGWYNTFACRSICEAAMASCGFSETSYGACTTFPVSKCIAVDQTHRSGDNYVLFISSNTNAASPTNAALSLGLMVGYTCCILVVSGWF